MRAQLKYRFTVLRFRFLGIWYRISRYKILKFDLDDWDDKQEHLRCVKSLDLALTLFDFDQWLREQYKYNDKEYCFDIREQLRETMDEYGVNLDELIS